jgi:starch synthase
MYEPCGLGQLISLKYGTVPIVRKTGGLADTVFEFDAKKMTGNGFLFTDYSGAALVEAARKAYETFQDPEIFRRLSESCMQYKYSWQESAKKYLSLYNTLLYP